MIRTFITAAVLALALISPRSADLNEGTTIAGCELDANAWRPQAQWASSPHSSPPAHLQLATYNLHSGLGLRHAFWKARDEVERNLRAVAQALASAAPEREPIDIVALNEVDFAARRSGGFDEARFVADELGKLTGQHYQVVPGETWRRRIPGIEVRFGNAALVRLPVIHSTACLFDDLKSCGATPPAADLPPVRAKGLVSRILREPRGVIKLTLDFYGNPLDVLITHLDAFVLAEREAQAAHLVHRLVDPRRTTVMLGDMNAVPTTLTRGRPFFSKDRTHVLLTSGSLADARIVYASHHPQRNLTEWATYPAERPRWPLDSVLGSLDLAPEQVKVIGAPTSDQPSDHLGLFVRLKLLRDDEAQEQSRTWYTRMRESRLAGGFACRPTELAAY